MKSVEETRSKDLLKSMFYGLCFTLPSLPNTNRNDSDPQPIYLLWLLLNVTHKVQDKGVDLQATKAQEK